MYGNALYVRDSIFLIKVRLRLFIDWKRMSMNTNEFMKRMLELLPSTFSVYGIGNSWRMLCENKNCCC